MKDENNKVVETAKNQADGTVKFKSLTFNKEGSYTYAITENKGTDATINYSTQAVKATVDVKKKTTNSSLLSLTQVEMVNKKYDHQYSKQTKSFKC